MNTFICRCLISIDSLQPLCNLKLLESLRLEDKTKNISNPGEKNGEYAAASVHGPLYFSSNVMLRTLISNLCVSIVI
jgi:hypothetical protein